MAVSSNITEAVAKSQGEESCAYASHAHYCVINTPRWSGNRCVTSEVHCLMSTSSKYVITGIM